MLGFPTLPPSIVVSRFETAHAETLLIIDYGVGDVGIILVGADPFRMLRILLRSDPISLLNDGICMLASQAQAFLVHYIQVSSHRDGGSLE